jgi:hypothetical protein
MTLLRDTPRRGRAGWWLLAFWVVTILGCLLFYAGGACLIHSYLNKTDPETERTALVGQKECPGCLHAAPLNTKELSGSQENLPTTSCLTKRLETLSGQVARDDIILDLMLDEPWVRDRKVYAHFYLISNGSKVWSFTQYPDPDKEYELSF